MNTTTTNAKPYPTAALSDILTGAQLVAVQRILNAHPGDPMDALPTLRAYLDGFREELLVKGLVSDYLAYSIVAALIAKRTNP